MSSYNDLDVVRAWMGNGTKQPSIKTQKDVEAFVNEVWTVFQKHGLILATDEYDLVVESLDEEKNIDADANRIEFHNVVIGKSLLDNVPVSEG